MALENPPHHRTDDAILTELGSNLARHRLDQNLTQADLAREAGISKRTVVRLEAGESTQLTNLVRVLRVLGLAGHLDALAPAPVASPLKQLANQTRRRKRASPARGAAANAVWTWGEDDDADRGGA